MSQTDQILNDIKTIQEIFHSLSLKGSTSELLESLCFFEQQISNYIQSPQLDAVIRWHKSLFLQKLNYYPRAEQLLDEALSLLEDSSDTIFKQWILRVYITLGDVHLSQLNYLDAETYLKEALALALSDSDLSGFLGKIYSLLSIVNLNLGRYNHANRYISLEKEHALKTHETDKADEAAARSYGEALVNFSRINRQIGLVEHRVQTDLEIAIDIFNKTNDIHGQLAARLEQAEFYYLVNRVNIALDTVQALESKFKENRMFIELTQGQLLAAKIYRKTFDYEQADYKLNSLFSVFKDQNLESNQTMADALYEMGALFYDVNEEDKALHFFREAAKLGMVLGIKNTIIRSFNASRTIDKYKARELLTSDLVYEDATFVRNRMDRKISPFKEARATVKLFASTLFVDIVGFSGMMMQAEEDITVRMVDELIDRMYLIIYKHNGYIDKFLGDGFMAIFEHGYSLNPEIAFNAIKAGEDIQRALKHKNRKLKKDYDVDKNINVRIGISTGEIYAILLGNYIKTEFTYLGNSVNLASKLESQAAEARMLIDKETYGQVSDRILSEHGNYNIPGLGDTDAYRVLRLARMSKRPDEDK